MVVEIIALALAIAGAFAAGFWDLRTTDVPDEITALMAVLGPVLWLARLGATGDAVPLLTSLALGTAVLGLGWGLYRLGTWGGGDAKLFAAIFYLLPELRFALDYIMNLLFVSISYLIVYSLVLGALHPAVFGAARQRLAKGRAKIGLGLYAALLAAGFVASYSTGSGIEMATVLLHWLAGLGLILFWVYAKAIEKEVFRRTIPASRLKVGDVLASSRRWDGATAEEVAKLRKTKKAVEIKEGVRFTPVFAINILVTIFFGNLLFPFLF